MIANYGKLLKSIENNIKCFDTVEINYLAGLVGSRRNKRPKTSGKFTLPVLSFLDKIIYPT